MHIVIDARNRRSSTGRYTTRLVEHLQKLDAQNNYTILVQPDDPWRMTAANFGTVPCRFRQFSFNPLDQLTFSWQLYRLKPDLMHFTMTQQPLFYFGAIVTTTHDLTMLRFVRAGRLPGWLHFIRMQAYKLLFWAAHKKSGQIIVPSNYVKEDLVKLQPFTKNKITVTYEASEPPLPGKPIQPPGLTKPFIFHVGSPFPHKNIERLIAAFELLRTKYPDLQLVLPGKKEFYFQQLEAATAASPVHQAIHFMGFVSDMELKWLYENAECYVLPSLSEGFGLPGLEAMVHGCPLVSSNTTCLPEVYGPAAHYFDPTDIGDMASKITEVMTQSALRQRLVQNGHNQAQKYSWTRMAEQTLAIYTSLLGS